MNWLRLEPWIFDYVKRCVAESHPKASSFRHAEDYEDARRDHRLVQQATRPIPNGPRLVVIESPYNGASAAEISFHVRYARACIAHSLSLGEAPIASHLLHTQPGILDDKIPAERQQGIDAGLAWAHRADAMVFCTDLGWSNGMLAAKAFAKSQGIAIEERSILHDTPWKSPIFDVAKVEHGDCDCKECQPWK